MAPNVPGKAVTLAETFASCVDHTGARLFYAITALLGYIAIGADAGNAFAEAPPPKQTFYMRIDAQFRDWWLQTKGETIPLGWVLPTLRALQGHPESPRLWEQHINTILTTLGWTACKHEQCVYHIIFRSTKMFLLRQVDDFAISCADASMAGEMFTLIGNKLQVPLHQLGVITMFNGINILQSRQFIRISCETYIRKILANHNWTDYATPASPHLVTPMRSDSSYMGILETAIGPDTDDEHLELEHQMKFKYRQAIGELIFCMVTTRPDISYAVIKLSQYSQRPTNVHYQDM